MSFPEIVAEWLRISSPASRPAGLTTNQRHRAEIDTSVRIPPADRAHPVVPGAPGNEADTEPKSIWLTHFAGELVMRLSPSTPLKAARVIASQQWSELRHLPPREAAWVWHGAQHPRGT